MTIDQLHQKEFGEPYPPYQQQQLSEAPRALPIEEPKAVKIIEHAI